MNIGEKIRNAREENNLTQTQAAESLMVSRQTISSWENGKSLPDILSVIRMSSLYQMSLDELLKGDKAMMEKIEKEAEIQKVLWKLIIFAFIGIFIWTVLFILHLIVDGNPVIGFLYGATPGVLLGLTFLSFIMYLNKQSTNQTQ